ncbi:membrane protein insertion efficiency factor YidD [Dermatophilus congolensis]|uniref:membrane protein insertion efficiency factor YidD n=1 Tax=Dermatophilus congolensis TaxID=1863 RepID=UPI0009FBC9CD|nr:membrane protein insertion efficiency factor YidD [Dermatophilus congolensis]MBO3130482.1 membrane protein insertion efficiency factor YidD [Dermatophilus congolensis]MBO3130888.1 membrane protein insertion efficiency factor YidD [Dermatophilus congolensis]MBO3134954.1 membrane protein insertion efficiency factor YidD [Dermatophilus congolensis]MBO3137193.1 membrane protein insertion efficiency factor YidD [Dermatophilus congolensis]MBO3139436.1 membrane protein insertion efficiency factor 
MLAKPFLWAIRGYQLFISPLIPPRCRFYPSCSTYMLVSIQRFGVVRGLGLGIRRLGRCHPWNPGGVDHVPARDAKRRSVRQNGTISDTTDRC